MNWLPKKIGKDHIKSIPHMLKISTSRIGVRGIISLCVIRPVIWHLAQSLQKF